MRFTKSSLVCSIILVGMASLIPAYTYYGPHLTVQPPWINRIDVYNNDGAAGSFNLKIWDTQGQQMIDLNYSVPANGVVSVVMPTQAGYLPGPGEIVLGAVEGACVLTTESERIRPKLSFQYGDSLSLCEFFMQPTMGWEYVLPNTIKSHFIGTGIAVMNPYEVALTVRLLAFHRGIQVGDSGPVEIGAHEKMVSISEGIWPGLGCDEFDLVRINSEQAAFPTPMSITWDQFQDRHVFFNAAMTSAKHSGIYQTGDLYTTDSIVGDLMFVMAGTFEQGPLPGDHCGDPDEKRFTHTLTRNIAVMSTEITRRMWVNLRTVQSALPADPTEPEFGAGMDNPAQHMSFYEILLFANLLSDEQGLEPCYYKDAAFKVIVDATNYASGDFFCDFARTGYRLPTEGEWEYCCRAGTTGPFSVYEPDYATTTCFGTCEANFLPGLETVAVFCSNDMGTSSPVGTKLPNTWGLFDMHGNVWEWCWDHYTEYPSGSVFDYQNNESGSLRIVRGGHWGNEGHSCRSANRNTGSLTSRYVATGFRLVRTLP